MKRLALAALLSLSLGPSVLAAPADPWAKLAGASRDEVVKALGSPELEFVGILDDGAKPLQIPPMGAPPAFDEDGEIPKRSAVRVLQYPGGARGMDFQVVLKDDHVLWAIAPPAYDEKDAKSVTKKYGKATQVDGDVYHADIQRTWTILAYPKKGRAFIRNPDAEKIVARVISPPTP